MSAIAELTSKKKTGRGRKSLSPSVRDNCRLCVKFGSQEDHIATENLFQPSQQTGSFDVSLANCTCQSVGLPEEYCEQKISWTELICSSCRRKFRTLHQFYSIVSSALFCSEKREEWMWREIQALGSSAAFQRRFLCLTEFQWVENFININTPVHDSVAA